MYTLLVSHQVSEQGSGTFTVDRSRFLEFTEDEISHQLRTLADEAAAALCSWPVLLMDEGRGEETAYLGRLTSIRAFKGALTLQLAPVATALTLTNDSIWRLRDSLDIGEFEFSRNHLAVKRSDLFAELSTSGLLVPPIVVASFSSLPLPQPPRTLLMKVKDALAMRGHTELDEILLEAGVEGMAGDRAHGSTRNRAIAMVKYALDNPSIVTAEGGLLSVFLTKRARVVEPTHATDLSAGSLTDTATPASAVPATYRRRDTRSPNRVFVVHGHEEKARVALVAFLRSLNLEPVVLHEQPSMGKHLLTKFIDEAELVTFAVVVMTADDEGRPLGATAMRPRARQNVILELGYFLAHLGQPRVCALVSPELETPSDFDGIVYIRMNSDNRWRMELERELRAAGMPMVAHTSE